MIVANQNAKNPIFNQAAGTLWPIRRRTHQAGLRRGTAAARGADRGLAVDLAPDLERRSGLGQRQHRWIRLGERRNGPQRGMHFAFLPHRRELLSRTELLVELALVQPGLLRQLGLWKRELRRAAAWRATPVVYNNVTTSSPAVADAVALRSRAEPGQRGQQDDPASWDSRMPSSTITLAKRPATCRCRSAA